MKIESIHVKNVRGLVDFSFEPKGKSVVVCGENGSGKSALVDALDFLLTGEIARLQGKGTGELSLQGHGPHVDHKPKEAVVSAEVSLPSGKKFKLERKISEPAKLVLTPMADDDLKAALVLAKHGYHVLSRREVLKFIGAEPGARAQEVQALLNLEEIERLRKLLASFAREAEREEVLRAGDVKKFQIDVSATLGLAGFSEPAVLAAINSFRAKLGGQPFVTSDAADLKAGLQAFVPAPGVTSNPTLIAADIKQVQFDESVLKEIDAAEAEFRQLVNRINQDEGLRNALEVKELIDIGISLIGSGQKCPLCEKTWDPDQLRRHLESRRRQAQEAVSLRGKIVALSASITRILGIISVVSPRLSQAAGSLGKAEIRVQLDAWRDKCVALTQALAKAPFPDALPSESTRNIVTAPHIRQCLEDLERTAISAMPKPSPQQLAWDTLTKCEVSLSMLKRIRQQFAAIGLKKVQINALYSAFENSRDGILGTIYKEIENTFVGYYARLHSDESSTFGASLRPEGAGLKFEVDFYGKGKFPPIAMHSEGHQDSMGLCLYLALMEKLTSGKIGITILDDVVMSVDSGHRRPVCDLLSDKFKDRQFIITTHDKMWARQLRNTGVVPPDNYLVFRNWTIDEGPRWRETDHWGEIKQLCGNGDVPRAAAALRRELEEYFDEACDALAAPIPYNGEAKYDRGDLVHAGVSALGGLLNKASKAAKSWDQQDVVKEISVMSSTFDAAKRATQVDDWVINESVHYNRWTQATRADFTPVYEAWAQLCGCFKCAVCANLLYVMPRKSPHNLRCRCSKINFNLKSKQ